MSAPIDMAGRKFGLLTAVKTIGSNKHKNRLWECRCECGNTTSKTTGQLSGGRYKSCGCNSHKRTYENTKWRGHGEISAQFWMSINIWASSRGIPVLVTIEEIWELYLRQNRRCALSGETITMEQPGRNPVCKRTASLDRIDSSKDYSLDNVQWVHKKVNNLKTDCDQSEFIMWCKKISEHNK